MHIEVAHYRTARPSSLLSSWTWEQRYSLGESGQVWVASWMVDPSGVKYGYDYRKHSWGVTIEQFAEQAKGAMHRRTKPKRMRKIDE